MDQRVTEPTERTMIKALARAVARKCQGPTMVLGAAEFRDALTALGVAASAEDAAKTPRTIVCFETVERLEPSEAGHELERHWATLDEGGALIVCARNADAAPDGTPGLHRKKLKRLMDRFGKARALKSQPFRWVGTVNVKGNVVDPDNALRVAATARKCHGRVLELGSGRGHLSAAIAGTGAQVLGIELNAQKVAEACALYPDIEFRQGDILDLGSGLGQFDTVVIAEVLEHVPDEIGRRMTDIAWKCVAPGGRLVVSTPYEDMVPHDNHVTEFSAAGLSKLLARYGPVHRCDDQPLRWLLAFVDKPEVNG